MGYLIIKRKGQYEVEANRNVIAFFDTAQEAFDWFYRYCPGESINVDIQ